MIYNAVSFLGLFILAGVAMLLSEDRRRMNWRAIAWGIGLQLIFAYFVFVHQAGGRALLLVSDAVTKVLGCALKGSAFVFGPLADRRTLGDILAFQVFPTIIFFSALVSILYYVGIMPALIRGFAYVFTKLMRVSGAESLCAASNIFVGIESALTIRPHLQDMTRSELCVVLTAGMATIASSVLGAYVSMLSGVFPTIAAHLISASILSAPAAIVMAKIMVPESGSPQTLGVAVRPHYDRPGNVFEAVIDGSMSGLRLIAGIIALLVAVLGIVALVDMCLGWLGAWINGVCHIGVDWSLKGLLGYVCYPFTLIMGVPPEDAAQIARVIGQRTVETEFAAYPALGDLMRTGAIAHERSAVICAYALCGFAHFASVGIFVGGTAALVPGRTRDLARLGFRALVAATLACFMTACVAGTFYTKGSLLFGR